MKAKKFIIKKRFEGIPKRSDFEIVEEELPALKDGEVLFEAEFLSVDPYQRPISRNLPLGATMIGTQVAKVLESKNPGFKSGDHVVGAFGWRSHTVTHPDDVVTGYGDKARPYVLPNFGPVPLSTALGVLGMPGNTALFGLTKLCQPKSGETLVVTTAAGAVGSLVGQIGKILGCNVIGFTGSDDKVKYLKEELGFDHAFNYKKIKISEALKEAAPKGVDCYFDNVGGEQSSMVMDAMNMFGRIAVCGAISVYNSDAKNPAVAPVVQPAIVLKQLKLEGFIVTRWSSEWLQGIMQNLEYIKQGKLKYKEHVVKGFENTDEAFIQLFTGDNTGKIIVEV